MIKYFSVEVDASYHNIPKLLNWKEYSKYRDISEDTFFQSPKRFIMEIKSKKNIVCPDILKEPTFMVSEQVYKVIQKFEPNIQWKEVILAGFNLDIDIPMYYIPLLKNMDCLSSKTEYNTFHNDIIKLVLNKHKLEDKAVFQISQLNKVYIIMRLDLVEVLLRRDVFGIAMREIELVED